MDALGSPRRVALFGGRSEIGHAIVRQLVDLGARDVALALRSPTEPAGVELDSSVSVSAIEYRADDLSSIAATVGEVFGCLGGVDVAVIAVGVLGPVGDQLSSGDEAINALGVNSAGASLTLIEVCARMREVGFGTVVLISSIAVERLRPSNLVYGASKSTADAVARALTPALEDAGVSVLVVRPGYVRTRLSQAVAEAPFAVDPEDVATAVRRGVNSGRSRVIWVPGVLRYVGLVLRVLPARLLARLDRR